MDPRLFVCILRISRMSSETEHERNKFEIVNKYILLQESYS